ncbi:MAG: tripartite tricarboxylate transporter TctB family protein [Deltaproteobacteria bacterium]|nr:tripartite tricarboxylate transporter TctB family protein [Deltaproteobacteria bacterium]
MTPDSAEKIENRSSRLKIKPLIGPLLIFIAAVYFYVLAGSIDENPMPGQMGPAFWPRVILILLMASCVLKALESYLAFGKGIADIGLESAPPDVSVSKLIVMIILVLAVVPGMEILGFALANFIFLILFMRIAGVRKLPSLIVTSLLGTIFLLYLFGKVVYLPLPKGDWIFNDLTIFIYRLLYII